MVRREAIAHFVTQELFGTLLCHGRSHKEKGHNQQPFVSHKVFSDLEGGKISGIAEGCKGRTTGKRLKGLEGEKAAGYWLLSYWWIAGFRAAPFDIHYSAFEIRN
jgi:hypothetical protein